MAHTLRIMPVLLAVAALPRERRSELPAAVRTVTLTIGHLGSALVKNPDLGPGKRAARGDTKFSSCKSRLFVRELSNPEIVSIGQVAEDRKVLTAAFTKQATCGQLLA